MQKYLRKVFLNAFMVLIFLVLMLNQAHADSGFAKNILEPIGYSDASILNNSRSHPLISNYQFLLADEVVGFDVQEFLENHPGRLKSYTEIVDGNLLTAADIIQYNAFLDGINPQLLLLFIEADQRLISDPLTLSPSELSSDINVPSAPFYSYIRSIAIKIANYYYNFRNGEINSVIEFQDGYSASLTITNAATYSLQWSMSQYLPFDRWTEWVNTEDTPFEEYFSNWFGELEQVDPVGPLAPLTLPSGYQLPFPVGETWYFTGGPHNNSGGTPGCTSGPSCPRPWSAVDIAQLEIIGCPNGSAPTNRWIVAAKGGNVITSSLALIIIDHGDGYRTYYVHVSSQDRRPIGGVNQGDYLGHPSCEFPPGGDSTGVHGHFSIYVNGQGFVENIAGSSLSGWLIQETTHYNGTMTRNGTTRTASTGRINGTNDLFNSGVGGSCPGPSLTEPGENAILGNNTITFRWNAPGGCTFSGYTFRIKNVSNMDSGGTTIIDTGEGGTQRTETINGWDNQDLYWGVRAANAPNGASWSVRHFRIEPSPPCPTSGGVILYWNAGYNCDNSEGDAGYRQRTTTGWQNVIDGAFNDKASSVRVPSGWSVKLFEHENRGLPATCRNGDDNDFHGDTYDGSSDTLSDSISSIEVYNVPNCNNDTTPPTLSWVAPVGNQQVYDVFGQTIQLEVDANDNIGVDRVVFERWDYVNLTWILIATDDSPPYRTDFNTDRAPP